jgi:hypothetical protein
MCGSCVKQFALALRMHTTGRAQHAACTGFAFNGTASNTSSSCHVSGDQYCKYSVNSSIGVSSVTQHSQPNMDANEVVLKRQGAAKRQAACTIFSGLLLVANVHRATWHVHSCQASRCCSKHASHMHYQHCKPATCLTDHNSLQVQ